MSNEIIEVSASTPPNLAVDFSAHQLAQFKDQILRMKNFVKSQLAPDVDYGVIPGCQKPSLYKAGAEKLAKLFGFGDGAPTVEKQIDLDKGWVWYSYTVPIIHLRTGTIVSHCEGSCNSKEKKYASRHTPDMINTIQKMAQKRAYVGGVIKATGASEIFTQDLEDMDLSSQQDASPQRPNINPQIPNEKPTVVGGQANKMATEKQARFVWAKIKNELGLNDIAGRLFIKELTGKERSTDLTSSDVKKLLEAIDSKLREDVK